MKLRLLIADDNEIQIESILAYVNWKELGVEEIKTARNGMECFNIAKTFKPHIVITDVGMPCLDGLELASRLKEMDRSIKIIFISCHEKFEYIQKAMEYGGSAYVLKPISYTKIKEVAGQIVSDIRDEYEKDRISKEFAEKQGEFEREFDISGELSDKKLDIFNIQTEIMQFVEEERENEVVEYFTKKYFENINNQPFGYTKYICYSVVNALQLVVKTKEISLKELFGSDDVFWNKIASFNTGEEIANWLINLLHMMIKHMIEVENSGHKKIVNDIKNLIDTDIYAVTSVEQIARNFSLSSGYIKNIFKRQTGITIFDYLFEKRMDEARRLLENSSLKVYEIAEKLGYKSKAYFSSTFQKYTGLTPNEYRKKCGEH